MLQALSFSSDGVWLLSAGKEPEQSVVSWDVETGAALTSGTTSQPVTALAWRPSTFLPAFLTLSKVTPEAESSQCLRACEPWSSHAQSAGSLLAVLTVFSPIQSQLQFKLFVTL